MPSARPPTVACKACGASITVAAYGPVPSSCSKECYLLHRQKTGQLLIQQHQQPKGLASDLVYQWQGKRYIRRLGFNLSHENEQQLAEQTAAWIRGEGQPPPALSTHICPTKENTQERERNFVAAVLTGLPLSHAALLAGYSFYSAENGFASALLKRPRVQALLAQARSPLDGPPLRTKAAGLQNLVPSKAPEPVLSQHERLLYQAALTYLGNMVSALSGARNYFGSFGAVILDPLEALRSEVRRFLHHAHITQALADLPDPAQLSLPMGGLERPDEFLDEDPIAREAVLSAASAVVVQGFWKRFTQPASQETGGEGRA